MSGVRVGSIGTPRSLTGWLVLAVAVAAALLGVLGTVAVMSYGVAENSGAASLHAASAQRQLQAYLRGVNEVLLTDGSSSSRKLVKVTGEAFAREITSLTEHVSAIEDRQTVQDVIQPTWKQTSETVDALLARKGVSASDDASMLAYGKISGRAEVLVDAVTKIEAGAAPAAAEATGRMKVVILAASLVAGLFVLATGRLVMQLMFNRLGGRPNHIRSIAMQLASHDLTVQIADSGTGERATVLDALRDIRNNLGVVVGNVHSTANNLADAATGIAQGNDDLSQRTEQQAAALEQAAASMQQFGSTVRQNADNAQQANQLAMSASAVATKGGDVVGQVVQTMKGINDSSKKIVDITGLIDGIAFQTNILALNAAVEAARAGEHGRGFAVVASEVRSLARRSAEAAREIKSLIKTSVERVEQGTALVDQAGVTMTEVVSSIKRVTEIMGEISAASSEQSVGVAQVGDAITHMDRATQQNVALVEESAAAAESLEDQAQKLVQTVAVFKLAQGAAASAAAPAGLGAECRGSDRARNVTRPAFGRTRTIPAAVAAAAATAKTGIDGDWTRF